MVKLSVVFIIPFNELLSSSKKITIIKFLIIRVMHGGC